MLVAVQTQQQLPTSSGAAAADDDWPMHNLRLSAAGTAKPTFELSVFNYNLALLASRGQCALLFRDGKPESRDCWFVSRSASAARCATPTDRSASSDWLVDTLWLFTVAMATADL